MFYLKWRINGILVVLVQMFLQNMNRAEPLMKEKE